MAKNKTQKSQKMTQKPTKGRPDGTSSNAAVDPPQPLLKAEGHQREDLSFSDAVPGVRLGRSPLWKKLELIWDKLDLWDETNELYHKGEESDNCQQAPANSKKTREDPKNVIPAADPSRGMPKMTDWYLMSMD